MRIDCHCHVFGNDCIPVRGLVQSRFGIALAGRRTVPRPAPRGGRGSPPHHMTFDGASLFDSLTNPAEKDNLRYLLAHPGGSVRAALLGRRSPRAILADMMEQAHRIDVWVPLMMDMEQGFAGSPSRIGFDEQKRIMMDLTAAARGRLWPFFAYDPRARPVDAVKNAIEHEGFVGVKLYPPLGFKPCGNEDCTVEDRLEDLYQYCTAGRSRPIPITAHCSWSDGIFSNRAVPGVSACKDYYRDMAHPAHWEKVLRRHKNLKLNLAHFGGAGEWERRARGGSPGRGEKNWADTIGALMREYDHVYTDLSFHGILAAQRDTAYGRALREKIRGVESRVLLGSDWYISAIQGRLGDYWRNFEALLPGLFDSLTGPNALRFLHSAATETFLPAFLAARQGYDGRFLAPFRPDQNGAQPARHGA